MDARKMFPLRDDETEVKITGSVDSAGIPMWTQCRQCNARNESSFKFCRECGAALATEEPARDPDDAPSRNPVAVSRLETKSPGATRWLTWTMVFLGCIRLLIWAIDRPTQTSRPPDGVLSFTDFMDFVEHHNIRAVVVNEKTGDVVGYYRIPANRQFRAQMPPGDSYLYDTLRKDNAEVIIK